MVDLPQPSPWAPLTVVAAYTRRPPRTIRTWARRLQVPSCCDIETREILVAWADVIDHHSVAEQRPPRPRRASP